MLIESKINVNTDNPELTHLLLCLLHWLAYEKVVYIFLLRVAYINA